ncbi:ATP-dependent DNA helicase pif1-like [Octopus bimaculoides]|uniref:ATP-dependent DNA helicase pif1-like n=1 Tax=Octopus bimaculoides TaxID=37653 RepID=UPI0022E3D3A9|nr:ATP-dependent DNA helicase pif1-like [Octopus bimaculoides]
MVLLDFMHQNCNKSFSSEYFCVQVSSLETYGRVLECILSLSFRTLIPWQLLLSKDFNTLPPKLLLELSYDADGLAECLRINEPKLLPDQRLVYETVVNAVEKQAGGIFFLDAPRGTGKSFVTQLILAKIRREKQIALAVASSGIAAMSFPLHLVRAEVPTCNIGKNSVEAEVLRQYRLIVWDECTMTNKGALEALNRSLKGIRDSTASMGGVTLLLSGDFWQTLPFIPKGRRADEVRACLKLSTLRP